MTVPISPQNDTSTELHPRSSQERIETLDILRGFAIFGILLVNMGVFAYPFLGYQIMGGSPWDDTFNRITEQVIRFFAEGKFYSLFALLFGIGILLQFERAKSRDINFKPYYLRRISILLVMGLLHAFLFWMGDILMVYALCGFGLLLFINRKPKTIFIWAIICFFIPLLFVSAIYGLMNLALSVSEAAGDIEQHIEAQEAFATWLIEGAYAAYRDGTIGQIFIFRALEFGIVFGSGIFWFPNVFAIMLIGVYAVKKNLIQKTLKERDFTLRMFKILLIVGIFVNGLYTVSYALMDPLRVNIWYVLTYFSFSFAGATLALAYVSGIILLLNSEHWQKRLKPFAFVGKMALTNYLLQTVICTTLFYNYGFGLYGSVGPLPGVAITILIFSLQVYLSPVWLRYFHYGPVEWLWRSLTYKKRQPFSRERASAI